jgi:hypothetical protein
VVIIDARHSLSPDDSIHIIMWSPASCILPEISVCEVRFELILGRVGQGVNESQAILHRRGVFNAGVRGLCDCESSRVLVQQCLDL